MSDGTDHDPGHKRRIRGLDALRGLAAISVLLYHYTAWYGYDHIGHVAPGVWFSFPYGNFGVELFFIISGFVIFMTLETTSDLTGFLLLRFSRLYPAFLTCLLITISVVTVLHYQPGSVYGTRVVANLTMMPALFGYSGIDGSCWSLVYELMFYGWSALVVLGLNWRQPEWPCLVWLAIALMIRSVGVARFPSIVEIVSVAQFAHLFVIGIMLYRIHTGHSTKLTHLVLGMALAMSLFGPHWAFKALPVAAYSALIAGFAALVWSAVSGHLKILEFAPLQVLGQISYPVYLVHQAAGFAIIRALESKGISANLSVAITAGSVLAVAWMVSHFVEWPAHRRLRRLIAAWAAQGYRLAPLR